MIFGFNTEVKHGSTVYHIQSEAREKDLLLQTQVFIHGRCIGKRATSYAERAGHPDFSEEQMHVLLKEQHRAFVHAAREGRMEEMLREAGEARGHAEEEHGDMEEDRHAARDDQSKSSSLSLEWLNADSVYNHDAVLMKFLVTAAGHAVAGARLVSRTVTAGDQPRYAQTTTNDTGTAEIRLALDDKALADSAVLVQATYGEMSATRKFRLKKS